MKLLATVAIGLFALSAPAAVAQPETNTTATSPVVNASSNGSHASIQGWQCFVPKGGLTKWWYQTRSNGPYWCTKVDASTEWGMLNAYRAGGQEGVHWKYTNDENDGECLKNWEYYGSDGRTLLATIPRTTTFNDNRRWCALPVYRQGGVKGKQWDDCDCWSNDPVNW